VELLELGVFGGENLEWSCFIGSGAAWSSPKHALKSQAGSESELCFTSDAGEPSAIRSSS
jgi:hypothetical protein